MSNIQLLDEDLIAKIKGIQIRARHLVSDVFAGEYQSAFKGRGLEFEEVREYQPGDDIRSIDWNVTARNNHPFVKVYRDERELTILFIVDVSASVRFGTVQKFKHEIAAEITALLAYTALQNNDKTGLVIFSDHVEHYLPPQKGRSHIWRLIRDILSYDSHSRKTNLATTLDFVNRVMKKRCVAFVISDFESGDFETQLRLTARRHDLIGISIDDPREETLPPVGFIELEDAESGEVVLVDSNRAGLRSAYNLLAKQQREQRERLFRSAGVDLIGVSTEGSYLGPIMRFFREREKRRGF